MGIHDELMKNSEYAKAYAEEGLILETFEDILAWMEKRGVSRAELAARLGTSRSYVTQLLGGTKNITLRTLATIGFELNLQVKVTFRDAVNEAQSFDILEEMDTFVPESVDNVFCLPVGVAA